MEIITSSLDTVKFITMYAGSPHLQMYKWDFQLYFAVSF